MKVPYIPTTFKKRNGIYSAILTDVEAVENQRYDSSKANSTPYSLTLKFKCEDPQTGEMFNHEQRFVNPLTGGAGLFQQLCDLKGIIPDLEGGEIDTNDFIDVPCKVTMGQRIDRNDAAKSFNNVEKIEPMPAGKKPVGASKKSDGDDDLPFS